MTKEQIKFVNQCIENNNMVPFYTGIEWQRLRRQIMIEHKYECQDCKRRGGQTRAEIVHHVMYVKEHPEYALERYYTDEDGAVKDNLLPVCKKCHERIHNNDKHKRIGDGYWQPERW